MPQAISRASPMELAQSGVAELPRAAAGAAMRLGYPGSSVIRSPRFLPLSWFMVAALAACGGGSGAGDGSDGGTSMRDGAPRADGEPDFDADVTGAPVRAVLEVYALDVWAQPLPAEITTLEITRDGRAVASEVPVSTVLLRAPQTLELHIEASDHEPADITLAYDGSDASAAVAPSFDASRGFGVALRRGSIDYEGRRLPLHTVFVGLRHEWFSAQGRPARRGNAVELLMDGEEGWASAHADLSLATERVHVSTWWWDSYFELVRDPVLHPYLTYAERRANTVLGMLEASAAEKRVIVGQFLSMDGSVSWLTSDDELRAYGAAAGDGFEFMGHANETSGRFRFEVEPFVFGDRVRAAIPGIGAFDDEAPIASTVPPHDVDLTSWPVGVDVQHGSWHQKFMVIDDAVAYVGGMNFRPVDWDTSEHAVFDERRMGFDATTAERLAVRREEELPENGPRKDYIARIEGPSVQDAAEVFERRWSHLIDVGARYSENASGFEIARDAPAIAGGVQAQITATMPAPFLEHAIAETWFNAVRNAERYIFIEDQYWRIPMLVDEIIARMEEVPALELVVITKPVSELADPGCAWTHRTDEALRSRFPGRYHTFRLRSFDTVVTWGIDETESRWADIDIHSKLLIVDDVFLSVGSANKNNRGVVFEGELNVAVVDRTWVRDARRRVVANILGDAGTPTDDPTQWIAQLEDAASWNEGVAAAWSAEGEDISLDGAPLPVAYTPLGFVYPLTFGTLSDCFFETVGPDQT